MKAASPRMSASMGSRQRRARVTAIVLAAGTSSRMGYPKQLADLGGRAVLEATLAALRSSKVDDIVLVLGHRAEEIMRSVPAKGLRVVVNPRYEEGMSTSIKEGLKALRGDEDAVMVVLGDQPLLRPGTVDRLLDAYRTFRPRAVVPLHRGQRGNPVILDLSLREAMESIQGDVGFRALLKDTRDVEEVDVEDPGVLVDIDTEEDLTRARLMMMGREERG